MRATLWFISLFSLAAATAWLAWHNDGTVALFWASYRIDLSLNLVLLVWILTVLLVVWVQQAVLALLALPQNEQRWRLQQKERAAHGALLESISHFMAGRFLRARKAAHLVLEKEALLQGAGLQLEHAVALRSVAHLMVAESAHALQDRGMRQTHWQAALEVAKNGLSSETQVLTEGAQLRAARWLLDDRDAAGSLQFLKSLPPALGRRVVAMRLQLKAARLSGQPAQALETAMLLGKHKAFTPSTADSLVRSLILEWLSHMDDANVLQRWWLNLNPTHRATPDLVAEVVLRFVAVGGEGTVARSWLKPLWAPLQSPQAWSSEQLTRMVQALEACSTDPQSADARPWLAQVELLQQARPQDARLQYLAGMVCKRHQLWGRAQVLLTMAVKGLQSPVLKRQAWCALAELAQQRHELDVAAQAWKQAALA